MKMKLSLKTKIAGGCVLAATGLLLAAVNYIDIHRTIKFDYSRQTEMCRSLSGLRQDMAARAEAQEIATVISRIDQISLSSYSEIQEARGLVDHASFEVREYLDESQLLEAEQEYLELEQQRQDLLNEAKADDDIDAILEYAVYDVQTSGNEYLDTLVQEFIEKATQEDMSRSEKLKACYIYMVTNYEYGYNYNYSYGNSTKSIAWATAFLRDGYGACNNWSSAFLYIAKALGYDVSLSYGSTANSRGGSYEHYWPVFHIDGADYVFDPQVERDIMRKSGVIRFMRYGLDESEASAKYFYSSTVQ